jgi:hypothetical protein
MISPTDAQGIATNQGPRQRITAGALICTTQYMLTLRSTGLSPPVYWDQLDYEVIEDGVQSAVCTKTVTLDPSCGGSIPSLYL